MGSAYWCEHPSAFADIALGKTEQDRAERVLKWFLLTLKGQYTVCYTSSAGYDLTLE